MTRDLRYALRVLGRRPVFTLTAVLSLGLGIGANTAVLSLLKVLQIDRLAVDRPDQLVQITGNSGVNSPYPAYETLRRQSRTLSGAAGTAITALDVEARGERRRAVVEFVTHDYFDVLGVRPQRGRLLHEFPATTGATAVLSDAYWRQRHAADPNVIGAVLRLEPSNNQFTIAGIAPPRFRGAHLDQPADIWVSIEAAMPDVDDRRMRIMGRLHPGETPARAEAEATAILGRPMRVVSGRRGYSALRERLTQPLLLLELIVGLVLAITCANLANLVMAGAAARDRELAVRRAIGASRWRVIRQLVTESVLLSAAGGALGLIVTWLTSAALLGFLPPSQSQALVNLRVQPDASVLGVIALLTLVTCVVCGLVPALRATRTTAAATLRAAGGGSGRQRTWTSRSLIAGEIALCTLLLVVAGVFLRSLDHLLSQDSGFLARGLVVADVQPPRQYSEARRDVVYEELRARLSALPAVEVAAFSHVGQLGGSTFNYPIRMPGRAVAVDPLVANEARVTPGFLPAMGTRLLSGRDVSDHDRTGTPLVAVVNQAFVREFGLQSGAIGQRFERTYSSGKVDLLDIIGVVEDAKWVTLREDPRPTYYVPYQQSAGRPMIRLAVRGTGNEDALVESIRQVTQAVDADLALTNVVPFREIVNRTLVVERLVAQVSTASALAGVLIACIGLYGVLAYAVVRRRREIGIRLAVGASPRGVEWMMLRESIVLLLAGFAIGLPVALVVTRLASSMLFGIAPTDAVAIAGTLGTLAVATLAAAYVPARRAASVDPIQALREE